MSKITDILTDIQTYAIRVSRNELRGDELSPAGAEQAILALIAEAIGEDEPGSHKMVQNDSLNFILSPDVDARNQLRAEIRERLGL